MIFDLCCFDITSYETNKKVTEHKDCYSIIFFKFNKFGPMLSERLGISSYWATCINQSVYFAYLIK